MNAVELMSIRGFGGPLHINEQQEGFAENSMKSGPTEIRLRTDRRDLIASQMVFFGAGHVDREICTVHIRGPLCGWRR